VFFPSEKDKFTSAVLKMFFPLDILNISLKINTTRNGDLLISAILVK
jgi:hypothetical protein